MVGFRTISARLILTISLIVAATCGILGTYSVVQQNALTRLALGQQLKQQYDSIIASIEYEGRTVLAVSSVVAALPPVRDAIAKGDRAALLALLSDPLKAVQLRGIATINLTLPPATLFLRVHDPKSFGDDVSDRRSTLVVANQTGKQIVGVESGRESLGIFGITPIMRDGKSVAVADISVLFGKAFVDRAKQRFGVDIAVHSFAGNSFTTIASTFGDSVVATQDELQRVLGGATVTRDATLGGHPAAVYLGQIKDYAGQAVAVLEVIKDTTEYTAAAATVQRDLISGAAVILCIGIVVALLLGRSMTRPLIAITATMSHLSTGNTDVTIPGSQRHDELGTMAKAVEVFRLGMIETDRLKAAQALSEQRAAAERRKAVLDLATGFQSSVGTVVGGVASAATELRSAAEAMAATSEETTRQTTTVTAAAELATVSTHTIAAATEQLSASIGEIGQQVTRSSDMIKAAVQQANRSNEQVRGLNAAAEKVGDVVKIISDIAGQTNLLALNATIEAARAGEAGKGFAVVASEVKALATQSARATEQIGEQIRAIQEATRSSAQSIRGIAETIGKVNEAAAMIASAVQEQGAATQEISRNVAQAAQGTQEVTANIIGVSRAANETGAAAAHVLTAAGGLSENGESLRRQLDAFLREVRAA